MNDFKLTRINTSGVKDLKSIRINTSGNKDLKSFRINTSKKHGNYPLTTSRAFGRLCVWKVADESETEHTERVALHR